MANGELPSKHYKEPSTQPRPTIAELLGITPNGVNVPYANAFHRYRPEEDDTQQLVDFLRTGNKPSETESTETEDA